MPKMIRLEWKGPYRLQDNSRVDDRPDTLGVYLWTVQLDDGVFYPIDVGEGNVRARLSTHKSRLNTMKDYAYDPKHLRRRESVVAYKASFGEPTEEQRVKAKEYGDMVQFFVLPISEADPPSGVSAKQLSLWLEAEVADVIESDPQGSRIFRPTPEQFHGRVERDIPVYAPFCEPIAGLQSVLWA